MRLLSRFEMIFELGSGFEEKVAEQHSQLLGSRRPNLNWRFPASKLRSGTWGG